MYYHLLVKCFAHDNSTGELLVESLVSIGPDRQFSTEFPEHAVISLESSTSIERPFNVLLYIIPFQLYIFGKYSSCSYWAINCGYRRQLILREIKILLPAVICLHEIRAETIF